MNKKTLKIGLIVCITCMLFVVASLFFSINLSKKYSNELSFFAESGEKTGEQSNSYKFSPSVSAAADPAAEDIGDAFAVFTYENIDFVSYSQQWDESKLEELAHELFSNVHGEEIAYVARVELHGDDYDDYAGLHRSSHEKYSLPVSLNNWLPNSMTMDFSALSSVIILTGADQNTTVASMARTMSHEYGHHFTQYYFGFRGTLTDMTLKYTSIRKEPNTPIYSVVTDWEYYLQNHMWDIQEIAAEDYVFLMGSPLAKQQIDYLDNSELVDLYSKSVKQYNEYTSVTVPAINAYPHENPVLDAPSQVDGLAEYYYSFVDASMPAYTKISDYGDMNMNIFQTGTGSYTLTWENPIPYSNISYTLVAYDANDYIIKPIKTIEGSEEASAYFGLQHKITNNSEYTVDDGLDDIGFVRFRIIITFVDGSVMFSDPFDVQF